MVKIICKNCGKEWDDKRYDMLIIKGISTTPRICCDACVKKMFEEENLLSQDQEWTRQQNMLIDSQIFP